MGWPRAHEYHGDWHSGHALLFDVLNHLYRHAASITGERIERYRRRKKRGRGLSVTGKHRKFANAGFGTCVRILALSRGTQVVKGLTGVELVFARVAAQLGQRVVDHVNHLHDPSIILVHVRSSQTSAE